MITFGLQSLKSKFIKNDNSDITLVRKTFKNILLKKDSTNRELQIKM